MKCTYTLELNGDADTIQNAMRDFLAQLRDSGIEANATLPRMPSTLTPEWQAACVTRLNMFRDTLPNIGQIEEGSIWSKPFETIPDGWQIHPFLRGRKPKDSDLLPPSELLPWIDMVIVAPKSDIKGMPIHPEWLLRPVKAERNSIPNPQHQMPLKELKSKEYKLAGIKEVSHLAAIEMYKSVTRVTGNGLNGQRIKIKDFSDEGFEEFLSRFDARQLTQNPALRKLVHTCFKASQNQKALNYLPILSNAASESRYMLTIDRELYTTPPMFQFFTYDASYGVAPSFVMRPQRVDRVGAIERKPNDLIMQTPDSAIRVYHRRGPIDISGAESLPEFPLIVEAHQLRTQFNTPAKKKGGFRA